MNEVVEMSVSTPEQFIRAIRLSQNIFEEQSVISVLNRRESFARTSELVSDIQFGITSLYKNTTGSFAGAQLSQYSIQLTSDTLGRYAKVIVSSKYFSNPKELNDLICVSAEIAGLLNKKVRDPNNTFEKISLFDKWVSRNFEYKNTCQVGDHTAIEFLKKRRGVCQAIAAIAILVLSYMGVRVLYVTGEGKGNNGWGLHAWNAVKINGRWIHVDFTFSMNSLRVSCTKTGIEERYFNKTHRWDRKEFNDYSMDLKWENIYWHAREKINIEVEANYCRINGVDVQFKTPLLIRDGKTGLIDIASIVRLLGGGIELNPRMDTINICVCNKRFVFKRAIKHFHDGYFDRCVLNYIWENEWLNGSKLRIIV